MRKMLERFQDDQRGPAKEVEERNVEEKSAIS